MSTPFPIPTGLQPSAQGWPVGGTILGNTWLWVTTPTGLHHPGRKTIQPRRKSLQKSCSGAL